MGVKTLLLVSLLAVLELRLLGAVVSGGRHGDRLMPGSPLNISRNDRGVQLVAFTAARSFNSQSNDAFLFRPSAIHRAQRQVVRGLRYIVELQISRTVCHKRDHEDLDRCELQPPGPLQQSFQCHLEAWVVPWRNQTTIQKFTC